MKPLTSRGSLSCWLYVSGLFMAVLGIFGPPMASAQNYPKEYIIEQPVLSGPIKEGETTIIDLHYAFGRDALDLTPVSWYRNGVLVGISLPVLQTYTTPTGALPKLWDPYKGLLYPEMADPATATINVRNACARWVATFTVSEPGMYRAKIGAVGSSSRWTYTNFAQVAMVPNDPSKALEIVRSPLSKSVSAPKSNPAPNIKLYGDMRSHILSLFNTPFATATDADGFTFIVDTLNHCIRRVSPGGHVTTLAGLDGQPYNDVELSQNDPSTPKRDALTRKERDPVPGITEDGVTNQSTKVGDGGYRFRSSFADVSLAEPKFRAPEAVAVSDLGVVYVADTGNNMILRIWADYSGSTPVQRVKRLFGGPTSADLKSPRGVFFSGSSSDPINNPPVLYVLDSANYSVKKLYLNETDGSLDDLKGDPDPFTPNKRTGCESIAGLGQTPGWQGVPVSAADARFYSPRGLVQTKDPATGAETVYVADTVNHVIRQITKVNNVWTARTVVGLVGAKGNLNAVGTAARLNYPVGLAIDEVNQLLYFTEFGNHSLRRVNLPYNSRNLPSWTVDLVAGSGYYGPTLFGPNGQQGTGNGDGLGAAAVFYYPAGISFDKTDGSIVLADTNNHCLRKIAIATSGENAWVGNSAAFAGTVGVSGNRDFAEMEEYLYNWKKDAQVLADKGGDGISVSTISGSETDTLTVTSLQYEDAGIYALVVTNTFDERVETPQSFVYVATEGDQPKFLSPGYRIESPLAPGVPLLNLQKGSDIYVFADILPSDQVTYQWEVTEDVPDANGDYDWIALSDLPILIQTLNNPMDLDTVGNAKRIRLGTLLGTHTTTISGSTTSRLAVGKLQASLTNVPPKLRFRVQSYTKAVPALPLETKVETITLGATWTVSPTQTVTVESADGLSVGMYLVGNGIAPESKITAIDTTNPSAIVLTLDTPALAPGTNVQVSGAVDLIAGTGLSIRYPVVVTNPKLSLRLTAGSESSEIQLDNSPETVSVAPGNTVALRLSGGTSAVVGNPAPTYQWYKQDSLPGTPVAISGATETTYSISSIQASNRGYYFVTVLNGVGNPANSNLVFVDVERPPSVTILSMSLDGGTLTQNILTRHERVVDKTKSSALTLVANVDASTMPGYDWEFVRDSDGRSFRGSELASLGASERPARTAGELYFADFPDEADGVFRLTATVGTLSASCSWRVTVKYLPQYVPGSKVFQVGGQDVSQDAFTVDLSEGTSVYLHAKFKSARTLPLTYRWRRDKVILAGETTNELRLDGVNQTDIGTYKLEVTNALGTRVFGPTLGSEIPFPENPPQAGWKLLASGKPSIVMQPNGKPLVAANTNVSAAMAGLVVAAPRAAAIQAANPGPSIQRVAKGQRMALQVAVSANPTPAYQWYRSLAGSDTFFAAIDGAKSAIYVLPPANDAVGTTRYYYVVATNPLGRVESAKIPVRVEGLPDPVITGSLNGSPWNASAPFPNGGAVSLTAVVTDRDAEYAYQWKVNGNNILGAVSKDLNLLNIESGQAGAYSVVVTGVAGSKESARYTVSVTSATANPRYSVTVDGGEELRTLIVIPSLTSVGFTAGTRVAFSGVAPSTKMLQSWRVEYNNIVGKDDQGEPITQTITQLLPARNGQFIMPAADVTVTPILSRPYTGNYTGFLSLEAPWFTDDGAEWATESEVFRPAGMVPDLGSIRGLFNCTVSSQGAVSGQIQLENKTYGFTTVLDAEMRGKFRIATTLKGVAWSMNGTLALNNTEENRVQDYVDNVMHVVLSDALLATPPLIQVGQTLYCSAVGFSGAADALRADIAEGLFNSQFAAASTAQGSAADYNFSAISPATSSAAAAAAAPPAAPVMMVQPRSTSVLLGGVATFNALASGSGPFTYQWFKTVAATRTGGVAISGATSSVLTIAGVRDADFAYYYVRVTNAGGSVTSAPARISLLDTSNPGGGTGTGGTGTSVLLGAPMDFTAAVYREANGETKENSFGQAAVLSVRVRAGTGATIVQGYLANGTRVTFSTFLGRAFITPEVEGPQDLEIDPSTPAAQPFIPTAAVLSGQAAEALSETLIRRSSSQSIPLWFRGDTATEPLVGTMIFSGPRVYGSLGALNRNPSSNLSEYTPNALAGYLYDSTDPRLASFPSNQFVASQTNVFMTTPDVYLNGLSVSWPTSTSTPPTNTVLATVDGTTGLLFGGMLETTSRYVQFSPTVYAPEFAGGRSPKSLLACTIAGVVIQKPDILPGFTWTPNSLGGYVGFIYRGKNAPLEPCRNVLGNETPKPAVHPTTKATTGRIEPFLINITDQY